MRGVNFEKIFFHDWEKWSHRQIPSHDLDVPEGFGIYGIYILGSFFGGPDEMVFDPKNIPEEVFYIGMSRHVDQRLAKSHTAVMSYRDATGDHSCQNLWYVKASSEWSGNSYTSGPLAGSYIEFYERALILQYVITHKKLPAHNKH
ncbi:hypothetical protein [Marinobacter sp.]|uniref:hypothetical protein n=1 Tax=Marinobacter sp. TaxID=50741 RepID=UPI00385147B3